VPRLRPLSSAGWRRLTLSEQAKVDAFVNRMKPEGCIVGAAGQECETRELDAESWSEELNQPFKLPRAR